MMACPVCKTEYDPHYGDCPTCGPMPSKPAWGSKTWRVPDFDAPGVTERVAAEAEYMAAAHRIATRGFYD